jgi:hypothetical protein
MRKLNSNYERLASSTLAAQTPQKSLAAEKFNFGNHLPQERAIPKS